MSKSKKFFYITTGLVYVIPFIVFFYLSIGKIFVYAQGPIHATDFETPLNPQYYFWSIYYPWHPLGLGSKTFQRPTDLIYGIIAYISMGEEVISQIMLFALHRAIAYTGILYILRKCLAVDTYVSLISAIFYTFSPVFMGWFTLPYQLSVSFIPWLFYIGLKVTRLFSDFSYSSNTLLIYGLLFTVVLSLISSLYYHGLPIILPTLVITSLVSLKALTDKFSKPLINRIFIFLILVGIFYLLSSPYLFEILVIFFNQERQEIIIGSEPITQVIESIMNFYSEATVLNTLKLASGTPINERYIYLRKNPLGILFPIIVFIGTLFINNKIIKKNLSRYSIYLYISSIINSIFIISFTIFIYKSEDLTWIEYVQPIYLVFAGLRRPERLLDILTLFYTLAIAFSLTSIIILIRRWTKRIISLFTIILILVTIFSHIAYSGIYLEPDHPAYSQFFVPKPKDFETIKRFLDSEPITSLYNSSYRYITLPSYVPMTSYLRYNYPNFLYYSSFSSSEVAKLVIVTNELIASKDPTVILPLSMASVKYLVIIPESFSYEELQAWRLRGELRAEGYRLFGDIKQYFNFVSSLSDVKAKYINKTAVFVNQQVLPRIYIPSILIKTNSVDLNEAIKLLSIINGIYPISKYAIMIDDVNQSENTQFVIDDYNNSIRTYINLLNLTSYQLRYKTFEESISLDEKSIVIFSEDGVVNVDRNIISIEGIVPSDRNYLSIWVKLPLMNLTGYWRMIFQVYISDKLRDNISFSLLDEFGQTIKADIEVSDKMYIDEDTRIIDVRITPLHQSTVSWFRMVLKAESNTKLKLSIEKSAKLEIINEFEVLLNDDITDQKDISTYPLIIPNNYKNITIIWPTDVKNGIITYKIDKPIDLRDALLIKLVKHQINGWLKLYENIKWLSPVKIKIDLEIFLPKKNNISEIVIPIFFGNSYDPFWKLQLSSEKEFNNVEIIHTQGNYYGNLWIINVSQIPMDKRKISFTVFIYIDDFQLMLYRIYMALYSIMFFLTIPIYIINNYITGRRKYI